MQLTHETTLELDRGEKLTPRGDCIACVSCRGEPCSLTGGYASLYIAILAPFPPYVAVYRLHGLAPRRPARGERMVARKSMYEGDSILIAAGGAARDAPEAFRRLAASSFSRCLVLHATYSPDSDVDPVDVLPGSVVKHPGDGVNRGLGE